jgi:hypothetical protein
LSIRCIRVRVIPSRISAMQAERRSKAASTATSVGASRRRRESSLPRQHHVGDAAHHAVEQVHRKADAAHRAAVVERGGGHGLGGGTFAAAAPVQRGDEQLVVGT